MVLIFDRIDAILYHSVTIVSFSQASAFLGAIQSRAEAGDTSFFAVTVKYLFFKFSMPDPCFQQGLVALKGPLANAKVLVSACSGLVALGLRDFCGNALCLTALLERSPGLPLKRLSLSHLGPNYTLKRLPPTLTHLGYPCGTLPVDLLRTVPLTHLHVSLGSLDNQTIVEMKQVVEALPSTTQMCIFSYDGYYSWAEKPKDICESDPRVAILGISAHDRAGHGSSWAELSRDCGFLPDKHIDSWEFFGKLVKERAGGRSECPV